jgi:tRNA-specific 2-thiouridylase
MSGGVDSSVAAALLVQQGFDVFGLMLRLWSEPGQAESRDNRCCTRDQMIDAHFVAKKLGIQFEIIDIQDQFKSIIVDKFIEDYRQGVTPNPCLSCNQHIRFTLLLNEALDRGASHLATGHYARITHSISGMYELRTGIDPAKDQSYVLSRLDQRKLQYAMFPLGDFTKSEVRNMAAQIGLKVATKADSQDLCFLADGNYRRFLHDHSPDTALPGPIIGAGGQELGTHTGLSNYTIGQRKGLNVGGTQAQYVLSKNLRTNTLVVGDASKLGQSTFRVDDIIWTEDHVPEVSLECDIKIRYKAMLIRGMVHPQGGNSAHIVLDSQGRDVTPGQGAVFYEGDRVIGSGIIALFEEPIDFPAIRQEFQAR